LVLRLLQRDRGGDLGPHRPQAERGVGDALPGEPADQPGEHVHAEPADPVVGLLPPEHPRPGGEVGLALQDRGEYPLDVGRVVLPVGVGRDDVAGAALARQPVAEPERRALPAVHRHVADHRPGLARLLGGAVGGAVDDHDGRRLQPLDDRGDAVQRGADAPVFVVRGDDDRDGWQVRAVLSGELRNCGVVDVRARHTSSSALSLFAADDSAAEGMKSGHTVAIPEAKSWRGRYPSALAAEMSSTTAGISPCFAGTCSAGMGAPVTFRAASISSFTLTDVPDPTISGPSWSSRQASRMAWT